MVFGIAYWRRRGHERGWRVVEAQTAMRAIVWLAAVLMAAGCTLNALSPAQAQQKRRCLEAGDIVVEAS